MTLPGLQSPSDDVALVLAGGGARAAYQVGVLSAIAERVPDLRIPILTGVSAGAINIAYLAAHRGNFATAVAGLRTEWSRLTPDQVYSVHPVGLLRTSLRGLLRTRFGRRTEPGTVKGLMNLSPLTRFLEGCMDLSGIETNILEERLRAVALSATSYTTGQTVTFMQGVSDIPVDGFYGDGSVRQIAPLAPAIHLGATRIIAITMRSGRAFASVPVHPVGEYPASAEVMGLLFNAVFLDSLDADAERLERINHVLERCAPGTLGPGKLRPIELLMLRPSRDLGVLSRGHGENLPKMLRWVVNSIGARRPGSSDFVSYLLFEPTYTNLLVELGYEDTVADWDRVERFLEVTR
jgi:NTE family protein